MTEALNQRPEIPDVVITPQELKEDFLFGLSFKNDDGEEMGDRLFMRYILSAQEWFQREIDVVLMPTDIVAETHDYYLHDLLNYGHMKLFRRPLQAVTRYAIRFPLSNDTIEFDPTWFKADSVAGTINLVPSRGSIERFLSSQGAMGFLGYYGGDDHVPLTIEIDYTCGFKAGKVPADIVEVIAMQAALGPLNIAGDLLGGAGIASKSLSIDGLSESISTTSSATNSGYGSRVIQYEKQIKARMDTLRASYTSIQMVIA